MHPSAPIDGVRSAKIDLLLRPSYVILPVLCPLLFIWLIDIQELESPVFEHVVITERPGRHCCPRLIFYVTVFVSEVYSRLEPERRPENEYGSNEQPVGPLRGANARLHVNAPIEFRIKAAVGTILALLEIPATAHFSSKPPTVSGELPMSSITFPPPKLAHRLTPSAGSEDALLVQVGEPSSETFYPGNDHFTPYPNKWAKIRLAIGIIYYCP